MDKKINLHKICGSNLFITFVFIIFSILSGIFMYHSHFIGMEWDLEFHFQRVYEIKESLIHGSFSSMIALNYFHQSGSAVMSMYPKINLLPMVILAFLIKSPVTLFNVAFILRNFFDLLISFLSSYTFNKNKKISLLFSLSYVLASMGIYYYYGVSALGTLSVISYLPLVLFGFLSLLKYNKWVELTLGVSAIVFSHILSTGIVLLFLIMLFLANLKAFKNTDKVVSLAKSILSSILITSVFWIPFVIISIRNKMIIPTSDNISGNSFSRLISNGLDNSVSDSIGVMAFIGLLLGFVYYKKLSVYSKQLIWIATIFIIFASDLFPWSIAEHTAVSHIQFPSRLYIIPQVLLCYILAECIVIITSKWSRKNVVITLISLFIMILQMGAEKTLVNSYSDRPELKTPYNYNINYVVKNKNDFDNIINSKANTTDYYPAVATNKIYNIDNHLSDYGKNKHLSMNMIGNGKIIFNSKNYINKLSLPFLYYNGVDYQVKLDGKTVKGYPNKNALMTINNVHKGEHHVQIIVHKTKSEIVSYILSLIGLLILIGAILKSFLKKHKND